MKRVLCGYSLSDVQPFDTSTTNMSYYDNFLDARDLKYMQDEKNRTGQIVMMTPRQYFRDCAKMFGVSVDKLILERDDSLLPKYIRLMKEGTKFPLPFIDADDKSQEGLHRMLAVANLYGWQVEVPVLVISVFDTVREARANAIREVNDFQRYVFRDIIDDASEAIIDWQSPPPENVEEVFKKAIISTASKQGYNVDIDVELGEYDGAHRLNVYLNSLNDVDNPNVTNCSDHWLEDMFDMGVPFEPDDIEDIDDELDLDDLLFKKGL